MAFTLVVILSTALFLAYANGANDNFKGVATLYGSDCMDYRTALLWATVTTFAGSLAAGLLAGDLLVLFSGKGLVADSVLGEPAFLAAVMTGAAATVFATALAGMPISTTHAITGALAGAGLAAAGDGFRAGALWDSFFFPLAAAPLIPILLVGFLYPIVRAIVIAVLKGTGFDHWLPAHLADRPALASLSLAPMSVSSIETCGFSPASPGAQAVALRTRPIARIMEMIHVLSGGAVSFARGLNDTPKIMAIALAAGALDLGVDTVLVGAAMALGGLVHSRPVAETMAKKITHLSPGQGTLANLVTSFLVLVASRYGVPVSTTHVSVGAIVGIGVTQRDANWRLMGGILSAWILTLPAAMALAALAYLLFSGTGLLD